MDHGVIDSIRGLTDTLISVTERHVQARGLEFDRANFVGQCGAMVEYISEVAHLPEIDGSIG